MPYTKAQLALFHLAAKGKSQQMSVATGKKLIAEAHGTHAVPKNTK